MGISLSSWSAGGQAFAVCAICICMSVRDWMLVSVCKLLWQVDTYNGHRQLHLLTDYVERLTKTLLDEPTAASDDEALDEQPVIDSEKVTSAL